jgi:cation/acetate symporter
MPAVYGALGRVYTPELLLTGETDAVVLLLPTALIDGLGGQLLAALVTAGAFAAFLSTSTGLVAVVAGVLGQDLLPVLRRAPPAGPRADSLADLRRATLLAGLVPLLLAVPATAQPVSQVVGLAFAVAASTFCPLLVLGIWWRRLTDVGATAGVLAGAACSGGAALCTLLGASPPGWWGTLLASPAAWSVPAAFLTMVAVSLATPRRVPADVASTMLRLHAPESLGLGRPAP